MRRAICKFLASRRNEDNEDNDIRESGWEGTNSTELRSATGEIAPTLMPTDHHIESEDEEQSQSVRMQRDATFHRAFAMGQRHKFEEVKRAINVIERQTGEQIATIKREKDLEVARIK
jgi:hypothetical protein